MHTSFHNKPLSHLSRLAALFCLFCIPMTGLADYATWIATSTPSIPELQQGESDDPDLDGVPSGIEYLVEGMNPGVSDAHLMPAASVSGDTLTYAVNKRSGIEGITTKMEIYDIGGNQWVASPNVTEDAESIVLTETVGSSAVLARINVMVSGAVSRNPIEAAYPDDFATYFQWTTEQFAWDQEFDVTAYGAVADGDYANSLGTDNWGAFNDAMAAASAWALANGKAAIVRVPAGTYFIGEDLLIPPGVVLRGADPATGEDKAIDSTNPDGSRANINFNPPSKLVFPKYLPIMTGSGTPVSGGAGVGFKRIYSDALAQWDASDTDPLDFPGHGRIGLVNLDINRAAIILDTPDNNPIKDGGSYSGKGDSTILTPFTTGGSGVGRYFIVYGIRSNNAGIAQGAHGVPSGVPSLPNQEAWQRNPYVFNASIRVLSGGYAVLANNQVSPMSFQNTWAWGRTGDLSPFFFDDSFEQEGYKVRDDSNVWRTLSGAGKATFRHTNQYGISLNGLFFFAKAGKGGAPADPYGNENGWYGSPTSAPWLFRPGHHILDNWIYTTLGGKIEASGDGLRIIGNVLQDSSSKATFYGADGTKKPSNGSAFLSRGALMGGADVVSSLNYIITTKHNIGDPATGLVTSFFSNDGEGLMIDNTTTNVYGWTASNNLINANIFAFTTKGVDRLVFTNNSWILPAPVISSNGIPIWIDANPTGVTSYAMTNSIINGNTNMPSGSVIFKGGTGSSGNVFTNNETVGSQTANLSQASHFDDTSGNIGFTINFAP